MATRSPHRKRQPTGPTSDKSTISGVVIGVLIAFDESGNPLVVFPGNRMERGVKARTTIPLTNDDLGREVALLFEGGDPNNPLIIGPIQRNEQEQHETIELPKQVEIDGERIVLAAKKEIVLKCGKASITLTKAGKVLIRGAFLLSRSSGVNRVKGGSVQIN